MLAGTAAASGSRSVAPPSGAALAALAKPPVYTSLASQRIYFVMPDRYANGDPSNDTGGLTGGRGITGFDPTNTAYYHGGDLTVSVDVTNIHLFDDESGEPLR